MTYSWCGGSTASAAHSPTCSRSPPTSRTAVSNCAPFTETIDTTTPGGRLIFHVFGAVAEFERAIAAERTAAGVAAARAARPPPRPPRPGRRHHHCRPGA
ncbi:MAG: recombinase family protein [Leucobacter sp.]